MNRRIVEAVVTALAAWVVGGQNLALAQQSETPETGAGTRKVRKTDAEWAKVLTRDQFEVTRRKATEPPFSGRYVNNHAKGLYTCVCCGAELFSSLHKFDSGTGWPSFFRPIDARRIDSAADYELAEARIEVMCRDCGAHLGHVFNDGPPPTGMRYCINSVALKFKPGTSGATTSKSTRSAAKAKTKARGKEPARPPDPPKEAPSDTPPSGEAKSGTTGDPPPSR